MDADLRRTAIAYLSAVMHREHMSVSDIHVPLDKQGLRDLINATMAILDAILDDDQRRDLLAKLQGFGLHVADE